MTMVPPASPVTVNVLDNDYDVDGTLDPATVTVVTPPTHGTVSVLASGAISYTVTGSYSGSDSFTYTVRDDSGFVSNAAHPLNGSIASFSDMTSTPQGPL